MAKANKGLRTYDGAEGLNASLGQAGIKVCTTGSGENVEADIIGFHIVATTAATGTAQVAADAKIGDGIGVFATPTYLTMETGTFIYGPFKNIKVGTLTNAMVLAYYG